MSPGKTRKDLPEYEYPKETTEKLDYADLEALDISKLDQPGGIEELSAQVLNFINKNGFFYVAGHGLTDEDIRRQYAIAEQFFDLPLEEKTKYLANTAAGDFRGYKARATGEQAGKDNDERYNIPKFTPEHERPHPQLILDHYEEIKTFSLHIHNQILLPLLRIFAHALELDTEYFVNQHRYTAPGLEYLRYMKYHPSPRPLWAIGHTDYNTLTFLFHQPISGLQVQTPLGWKYIRSSPLSIIVNVADALELLSGGYLKSTVHRVVRPPVDQRESARLSLIYFARPESQVRLERVRSPLLERLGVKAEGEESLGGVTAEEWARARIAKDHRFRAGLVGSREGEIIAGVKQKYYD
ncbi:putative 1-aminocyclopropane-1-carboxylate oxidase [Mollisia scopiformis]|uniref:Putative 1-aminocyclopropane-1-carboxylate oxidase n=1 Tax=Mollisia scopiformis TaxID=149040 RepID=A0A194XVY7_MOLSC|nr:putative 1-aminocyclopropane-1-carboxylate oxidase [Mollisia scopiformis]KUJ24398.1 putative 1-aminocyclopropane-1-carboxylate oxidase [Mollisia scopiformis]